MKRTNSKAVTPTPGKAQGASAPAFKPNNSVKVDVFATGAENEDLQSLIAVASARQMTRPEVVSATVIDAYQPHVHDVNAVAEELKRQIEAVNAGDLRRAEGLLVAQAHALDRIFGTLVVRATQQQLLPTWEVHMRMALRAQNQCRATLETLAALKYPSAIFTHQANINHGGQQQVNNGGTPASAATRVPGTENGQTKLLKDSDGQWLDTGAQGEGRAADSLLAPLGALDGPAEQGGKGQGGAQRMEGRNTTRAARAVPATSRAAKRR